MSARFFSLLAVAPLLAGCSLSTFGGGVSATDVDGDGNISSGERVLYSYKPTEADESGSTKITQAQKSNDGVEGIAAGTDTSGTRTSFGRAAAPELSTTNEFKNATVKFANDNSAMQVTIDGRTLDLPSSGTASDLTVNGQAYKVYKFGLDGTNPTSTSTATQNGDGGSAFNGEYSSLAMFIENAVYDSNGVASADGYGAIITGLETPENKMPTAIVEYGGIWFVMTNDIEVLSGEFDATVDFNAGTLSGIASNASGDVSTLSATITGNKFSGNVAPSGSPEDSIDGEFVGGFYGPNAEELAGIANGDVDGTSASGAFLGNKQP